MAGKHRKRAAGRIGCVVITIVAAHLVILLTALADQGRTLIG
ncbi:hypothetical protein [Amycolatopsis iheyensis]|nr:hypothetical protein [Amycolatopsis iheyensis]